MTEDKKPGPLDGIIQAAEKALEDLIGKPAVAQIRKTVQEAATRKDAPPWSEFLDKVDRTPPPPAPPAPKRAPEADDAEFEDGVRRLVNEIEYKGGYRLLCERDKKDPEGRLYLQVECNRPDAITGVPGVGRGGKAYLSPHMTTGEIIRKAFGLFIAYEEHECREFFRWNGRAIFGPHIDPAALWSVADKMDFRRDQTS